MRFEVIENKVICIYEYHEMINSDWVRIDLKEKGEVTFRKTLTFSVDDSFDLTLPEDDFGLDDLDSDFKPVGFVFALKEGEYFKIKKNVITSKINIYFHEDYNLDINDFVAENKISIFGLIEKLTVEDIYIGGAHSRAIPIAAFINLIGEFPNSYEKKLYAEARVAAIIKDYFENVKDSEERFKKYLNKKVSKKGENLSKIFKDYELAKYATILEKLEGMLREIDLYNENQWQNEILEIILLLYPKYLLSFKSVHIKADFDKRKFLDFMLIDGNGNIDIIEIKKPMSESIMTHSFYRDNYIPQKELTGTVMQLEKYIYYLNRWGTKGEEHLTKKFFNELPNGISIKITNPKGFIIMGRDNTLSLEQKADFEVVKRKYKNVIDIITYDDLIQRLKSTVERVKVI